MTMETGTDVVLAADTAAQVLDYLVDLGLKGVLLLAAAGLVTALMRRASAATRHLVWGAALCGLLVLPLLAWLMPGWHVPVFPGRPLAAVESSALPAAAPALDVPAAAVMPDAPAATRTAETDAASVREPLPGNVNTFVQVFAVLKTTFAQMHWTAWLVLIWAGGAVAILLQLALGALGVWRLSRTARPVHEPEWLDLADEVGDRLFLTRPIVLLRSTRTATPMTWGFFRPVVLLPADADSWTEERRRCVLTHECAHVQRWDCLTQMMAQIGCALFWFNPLAWIGLRHLRTEREKACDDYVLAYGTLASSYATHLIDIARTVRSEFASPLGAVAMAKPSQLEGRVLAILDAERDRQRPSRRRMAATVAVAAGLLLPLAAMRPWPGDAPNAALNAGAASAATAPEAPLPPREDGVVAPQPPAPPAAARPAPAPAPSGAPAPADESLVVASAAAAAAVHARVAPPHGGRLPNRSGRTDSLAGKAVVLGLDLARLVGTIGEGVAGALSGTTGADASFDLNGDDEIDEDEMDELIQRRVFSITEADFEAMRRLGYDDVSTDDLVAAKIHGVDPAFVRAIRDEGFTPTLDELVGLRVVGVDRAYIRDLASLGLEELSLEDLVQLRAVGVDKAYVLALRKAGVKKPSIERIVELRALGIVPKAP